MKTSFTYRGRPCKCAICQTDDDRTCETHTSVLAPNEYVDAVKRFVATLPKK